MKIFAWAMRPGLKRPAVEIYLVEQYVSVFTLDTYSAAFITPNGRESVW
jgi:hypothetical protein